LGGIAEHGRGERLAVVDVEAAPFAFVVGEGEARQPEMHTAFDITARLDGVERRAWRKLLGGGAGRGQRKQAGRKNSVANSHIFSPLLAGVVPAPAGLGAGLIWSVA